MGEDATVDLSAFSLDGGQNRKHRQAIRRLEVEHAAFRVVPACGVGAIIDQLRDVSDDWLREKSVAEKGFSLGFFDPAYISRFPVAVIEHQGRIVAFANLFLGAQNVEMSLDLMRYHHEAPKEGMEALRLNAMLWGQAQGYKRFALGMARLSGCEDSPAAPLWNRLGGFVYKHGEAFYNFRGLRLYKDKFKPEWEPRYLIYPGGLKLPRILADVSALIAGGYRQILLK